MTSVKLVADDFDIARGALGQCRKEVFEKWKVATDAQEKAFYSKRVDEYDALLAKFDKALQADTSQDADEEADQSDEDLRLQHIADHDGYREMDGDEEEDHERE